MEDAKKPQGSWFQTLPGMLTAIGGVITALAALVGVLHQSGLLKRNEGAQPQRVAAVTDASATPVRALCERLNGHAIQFTGNRYPGTIGPRGIVLTPEGNGRFTFTTNIIFSADTQSTFGAIDDPISGECEGQRIQFTRKLLRSATGELHNHFGEIKEVGGAIEMRGKFSDGENRGDYDWDGRLINPVR
jgi:hypothetical protein